jgi:hypothetical protein
MTEFWLAQSARLAVMPLGHAVLQNIWAVQHLGGPASGMCVCSARVDVWCHRPQGHRRAARDRHHHAWDKAREREHPRGSIHQEAGEARQAAQRRWHRPAHRLPRCVAASCAVHVCCICGCVRHAICLCTCVCVTSPYRGPSIHWTTGGITACFNVARSLWCSVYVGHY